MTGKISLPHVTLCAAASVNLEGTVRALQKSMRQIDFGEVMLFTNRDDLAVPTGIRVVKIGRLASSRAYSLFMLHELPKWIEQDYCLVVQWDGFVLDASAWENHFLDYDYIGAPWPQFDDGHDVGNGGFSLRSRKLLQACASLPLAPREPEDVAICRSGRSALEAAGLRFPDAATASRFSYERDRRSTRSFGFHGVFNLVEAVGAPEFWTIYKGLDDRRTVWVDFRTIVAAFVKRGGAIRNAARIVGDLLRDRLFELTRKNPT